MDKALIIEAMKLMQRKYGFIHEISKITLELSESVARDDRVSIQMLINMRQTEMENADQCDMDLNELKRKLPFKQRLEFENLLRGEYSGEYADSFEIKKIKENYEGIQSILTKAIEMDRMVNRRIGGDKSFYSVTKSEA